MIWLNKAIRYLQKIIFFISVKIIVFWKYSLFVFISVSNLHLKSLINLLVVWHVKTGLKIMSKKLILKPQTCTTIYMNFWAEIFTRKIKFFKKNKIVWKVLFNNVGVFFKEDFSNSNCFGSKLVWIPGDDQVFYPLIPTPFQRLSSHTQTRNSLIAPTHAPAVERPLAIADPTLWNDRH